MLLTDPALLQLQAGEARSMGRDVEPLEAGYIGPCPYLYYRCRPLPAPRMGDEEMIEDRIVVRNSDGQRTSIIVNIEWRKPDED